MGPHELRHLPRALIAALAALLALAAPVRAYDKSFIPIPEIITDPNEGNTFGLLGVVLFLDEKDEIKYMLAPDATYNDTKGFYPTFRFLGYPTSTRRYSVTLGRSTTKDEDYEAEFADKSLWDGRAFFLAKTIFYERDSTERFFGFGNESKESNESNYTSAITLADASPGFWILPHVNLAYRMKILRFAVERGQVTSFPFIGTPQAPPATRNPALRDPGHIWAHRVSVAYDTRDAPDIPSRGMLGVLYTDVADRALGSTTSYVKFGGEWRDFLPIPIQKVPHLGILQRFAPLLATRVLADWTTGSPDVPFWEQSSLGGRRTLRGFGGDRFIDFNRTLGTAELRTRVYQRHLFGVNAEIEVAPFFEAGKVFRHLGDNPVNEAHLVYGVGFRGIVRPQIVGFVDIGRGSEGTAVFTGVDYPF
jgi:outer membrane protein assembly factor BamA